MAPSDAQAVNAELAQSPKPAANIVRRFMGIGKGEKEWSE
jgi:hypothetical protein